MNNSVSRYKVLKADTLISEEQLNELAMDGWLLVQIVLDVSDGQYAFYLRRDARVH